MASKGNDASGVIVKPSSTKQRGFPWRLWLWALLMTAAAGAGAYFVWHYRGLAQTAETARDDARSDSKQVGEQLAARSKALDDCATKREQLAKDNAVLAEQDKKLSSDLKASGEELAALRAQKEQAKARLAAIDELQKQFAKMIDTGALKVTTRRGMFVLSLPAEVLFPSGVAELSKDGELKVLEVGITLKKFVDRRFLVVGHSDNQPLKNSTFKDNWELSTARALTVTRFLVQAGMDPKNLLPAGSGDHDPISAKDLARNRRIEIALMPALSELPPLPNLGGDSEPGAGSGGAATGKKSP